MDTRVSIHTSPFSHKLPVLLRRIVDKMVAFTVDDDKFPHIHDLVCTRPPVLTYCIAAHEVAYLAGPLCSDETGVRQL